MSDASRHPRPLWERVASASERGEGARAQRMPPSGARSPYEKIRALAALCGRGFLVRSTLTHGLPRP